MKLSLSFYLILLPSLLTAITNAEDKHPETAPQDPKAILQSYFSEPMKFFISFPTGHCGATNRELRCLGSVTNDTDGVEGPNFFHVYFSPEKPFKDKEIQSLESSEFFSVCYKTVDGRKMCIGDVSTYFGRDPQVNPRMEKVFVNVNGPGSLSFLNRGNLTPSQKKENETALQKIQLDTLKARARNVEFINSLGSIRFYKYPAEKAILNVNIGAANRFYVSVVDVKVIKGKLWIKLGAQGEYPCGDGAPALPKALDQTWIQYEEDKVEMSSPC